MAIGGTMGRVLFVDLNSGQHQVEQPEDEVYLKFLGGYGLGAHYLYTRQKGGVDALGPDNILGFTVGCTTGTPAVTGNRYCVVGKSPKTGGWGDANSGGYFGPRMKAAGYDGIFFTGTSDKPVYLLLRNGKTELRDASALWGKDTNEVEDLLQAEFGKDAGVTTIGQAGERMALLAGIINDKGRAAGRSGLGAVMGSKKLKAIVSIGNKEVTVADKARVEAIRKAQMAFFRDNNALYELFHDYGTPGVTAGSTQTADCPIKNWSGAPADVPDVSKISDDNVIATQWKRFACWKCPIGCGGEVKTPEGSAHPSETHKPEYETLGVFGVLCLNNNLDSIIRCNEICNRAGMDTISTGGTVAFAIEAYEKGLINSKDTEGIELTWGNHEAIVALTEKIATGEGIGALLQNGVKKAAEQLGAKAEEFAMHAGGEELAMHDSRLNPGLGMSYRADATPGRHTQVSTWFHEANFVPAGLDKYYPPIERYVHTGKGAAHRVLTSWGHVMNAAGFCMFGICSMKAHAMPEFLSAIMGQEFTMGDVIETGARIGTLRSCFNLREGLRPWDVKLPPRAEGKPALTAGPLKNVTIDSDTEIREFLLAMGWDLEAGKPKQQTLVNLGLRYVADDLYA